MAASISVSAAPSGGIKAGQTVTATIAGATGTTGYLLQIVHPSGPSTNLPFLTTGGGGATVTFVPQASGSYTLNIVLSVPTVAATTSFQVGGHG
jgi:hypothetical protein